MDAIKKATKKFDYENRNRCPKVKLDQRISKKGLI